MQRFVVIYVVLDSGERLPTLVHADSWLPTRVATRWSVSCRRYQVQSSTLADNLRILGRLYSWADGIGIDLDQYLTSGELLDMRHLRSLNMYLQNHDAELITNTTQRSGQFEVVNRTYAIGTYGHHLEIIEQFLTWTLYPENRGGKKILTREQINSRRNEVSDFFAALPKLHKRSCRHEPVEDADLQAIQDAIAPQLDSHRRIISPIRFSNRPLC